ncbi:HNH endonuclease [Paraferrimonas haliotis]|nr:HNH endonuclease signature motif containing protein [Paraferrimonas haliotis]
MCLNTGVVTPAVTVDHIVAKAHGGTDHMENLQALCDKCHKAKTAAERLRSRRSSSSQRGT